jgi:hypothetical protein
MSDFIVDNVLPIADFLDEHASRIFIDLMLVSMAVSSLAASVFFAWSLFKLARGPKSKSAGAA